MPFGQVTGNRAWLFSTASQGAVDLGTGELVPRPSSATDPRVTLTEKLTSLASVLPLTGQGGRAGQEYV